MTRRLIDLLRGLGALAVLCALVIGVPLALAALVGWPLPAGVPSADGIGDALTRRGIDDVVVVKTLAVLLWLAWAQIAIAFFIELTALVRGRAPRRAPTLPSVQLAVARLVASAALISSVVTASRVDASVRPVVAIRPVAAFELAPVEQVPVAPRSAPQAAGPMYEVRRHDSLWSIAERTLGDGFRWREIRDLNVGRMMGDGEVITASTEDIRPGWLLAMPVGSALAAAVPATESGGDVVIVERGDHLWAITEDVLTARTGREPTDGEVDELWRQTIEANRDRLADPADPSLIFAGQEILVPGEQAVPAAPAADLPPPPPPEPETETETETEEPAEALSDSTWSTALAPERVHEEAHRPTEGEPSDAASAPTGMFGVAGAALAAGVGATLMRRRRRRLLRVPPGSSPPLPSPDLDDVRAALLLTSDEDLVASVERGVLLLASVLGQRDTAARPRVLQVEGSRVEVLLSSPVVPGADGWRLEAGGSVWVSDLRDLGDSANGATSYPTVLVSVGADSKVGQLYLDLEAEAVVSITGDNTAALGLARSFIAEIAHSAMSEDADVIAIGLAGTDRLDDTENVHIEQTWDDVADDVLARAERTSALLAANHWPNAFAARARASARDDLTPMIVVLAEPPADARFERVCELVSGGRTTVSLVVVGDVARASRIEVDGKRLDLPGLGLTCRAQALPAETLERVAEVLADADAMPAQLPLIDDVLVTPASLASRTVEDEPEVLVRVLGEIDVIGGRRPLTPRQMAVLSYLALHSPVAGERIEDAIWTLPTASRRKRMSNTVSDCRFALGEEHLPFAHEGRYSVGPGVGTDLELFERRVGCAADRPPAEAIPLLRAAVELVRGPVFTYPSAERTSYVWIDLENWMTTWELKVTDTALRLSDLAREFGDTDTAVWSAEQGLKALSTHAGLIEALMRAYRTAGDPDAATRVYERHVATLERLGLDDIAETTIDLRDEIQATRRTTNAS